MAPSTAAWTARSSPSSPCGTTRATRFAFVRQSALIPAAATLRARSVSSSAALPVPTMTTRGSPTWVVTPYGRPAPGSLFAIRSTTVFTARGRPAGAPRSLESGTMIASTLPTATGRTARNFMAASPRSGTSRTFLLLPDERADAGTSRVGSDHEDTFIALTARDAVVIEELQERQHMLAARTAEIARPRDGDRARHRELRDDRLRELRDRLGQEHRLGADAHQIAPLAQGGHELAVETEIGLKVPRCRRMRRVARQNGARLGPDGLL